MNGEKMNKDTYEQLEEFFAEFGTIGEEAIEDFIEEFRKEQEKNQPKKEE